MEIGKFEEKYRNYKWICVLENPVVKEFVASYNNIHTQLTIVRSTHYFVSEVKKTREDFDISQLFSLNSVQARRLIWRTLQSLMNSRGKTNRVARHVKTFIGLLYNYANEEEGKAILWKRKHRISLVAVRDKKVPTHSEIWEMVDYALHLRDKAIIALSYNSGLKATPINNLNVGDLRKPLEDFKINGTVPLIIKINAKIYPKRFQTNNNSIMWLPALVDRDCAVLLLKYYESKRKDAQDNEPFFVTQRNTRMDIGRISQQVRYLMNKLDKLKGGDRSNTYAMLIRDSFFNRLVKGGMKDIHREFLMMHTLGIKAHYFNWDLEKEEILESYLKCGFNRSTENNEVKKKVTEQSTAIQELKRQIQDLQELTQVLQKYDLRKYLPLFKEKKES